MQVTMWSPQQERALGAVGRWLKDPSGPQVFRLFGHAGTGKALAADAAVQTPVGPRAVGGLRVGDEVIGADGRPTSVEGVFPQGVRQAYRVVFRDGFSVECDLDHLWTVVDGHQRTRTVPLRRIIELGVRHPSGPYRFRIPLTKPVVYTEKDLPLAPYVLGALLGDGTMLNKTPTLCLPDKKQEILARVRAQVPSWVVITTTAQKHCNYHRLTDTRAHNQNGIKDTLVKLGCAVKSPDRGIPEIYTLGSIKQRWELLRGLMDTDGSCRNNRTSYSTKSERLARGVASLVQSLGGTAIVRTNTRTDGELEYSVNVKTFECPFHLSWKTSEWSLSTKNPPSRYIVSVEPTRRCEHVCIKVAAGDGLFLADHYIVTHNTTLAKHLAQDAGRVLFGAYTGKAAHVLQKKGCPAQTLHSLIYLPKPKSDFRLRQLEVQLQHAQDSEDERRRLETLIAKEKDRLGRPGFTLNLDSPVRDADLLIVDECSMVDASMAEHLLSFDTKILVLGDPFQLPPVRGTGFFTAGEPDFVLTEVHRQAADNPVLALATAVREHGTLKAGVYGESLVTRKIDSDLALGADQILVGRNATRKKVNDRMRELRGFSGVVPVPGERLVCLRNNHDTGLLNGSIWYVNETHADMDPVPMSIRPEGSDASQEVLAHRRVFTGAQLEWYERLEADEFDYGYALTVHKAQGSEWDRVLIMDESAAFRSSARRWAYTAITRASKSVVVKL